METDLLKNARIIMESYDGTEGIFFKEIVENPKFHNEIFFDKWRIAWRYKDGAMYYNDSITWKYKDGKMYYDDSITLKEDNWTEGNMNGVDMPYKKFFTPEEIENIENPLKKIFET